MLTKGAIGNLINRYRAVLEKCRLINVFGTLAWAGMLITAFADVSFAQGSLVNGNHHFTRDTAIEAVQYAEEGILRGRTGIIANSGSMTVTVADGKILTVTAQASDSRVYGAVTQNGANLSLNGDAVFTLSAAGQSARVFRASNGDMSINGTISGTASSEKDGVTGAEVWGNNTLSFSGEELSLSLKSSSGRIIGVQNYGSGSSCNFDSKKTTVSIAANKNSSQDIHGVFSNQSVTTFTGNTNISVEGGQGLTFGLEAQGNPGDTHDTVVNFSGDSTVIDVAAAMGTVGVSATGDSASIKFAGKTAEVSTASRKYNAFGVVAMHGARLNAAADAAVTVKAANQAVGVGLFEDAGSGDKHAASAAFAGDLSVYAKSEKQDAYGVCNSAAGVVAGYAGDGLSISGKSVISVTAKKNAYGVYGTGESSKISFEGDTDIQAVASDGESAGVFAEKSACISLGSDGTTTRISASGGTSTAIAISDSSSVSLAGTTILKADKAVDGTGTFANCGDLVIAGGTVDTFTGTYTQTGGATTLASDSNFFGGDVHIKKGVLTAGDTAASAASGAKAVLALGRSITIRPGKNLIIGTDSGTGIVFGPDSALVVDGNAAGDVAMLKGSDTLSVDSGSLLYVSNARAGRSYTIAEGLTADSYWDKDSLVTNQLLKASVSSNGNKITVNTKMRGVSSALPGVIPVNGLTAMISGGLNDTDSAYMGIRFLSRATEPLYMSSDARSVDTINEVSRAAVTAGVQNTSMRLADAAADTVLKHLSLAGFDSENSIHKDGIDVWATPMYGNTWTHDMSTSVCGNYGGLAIGADVHLGTLAGGNVRAGIAVSGGGGHSQTRDNVTSTDNSYNFGGVSLYGGWTLDNLNIMASLGYNMGRHDLEMSLPSSLGMGSAEADVYTRSFTADLRAEYLFRTDFLDIMPHIGVRYTAIYTDEYDLEVNGSRLNSVESDMQNIVQFPVGVTFSKVIAASGWIVRPQVDLAVVPAVGELRSVSEVSWSGINATDDVSTRIMDTVSYTGRAGIQAETGNFAIGLNYGIQAARHETNHSLNAGFTWKF